MTYASLTSTPDGLRAPLAAATTVSIASTQHYALSITPSRRHVRITTRGFWDHAIAREFGDALQISTAAMIRKGVALGTFRSLVDVREAAIMPQDLIGMLQSFAEQHGPSAERVVILAGNTLQKMQYKRIAPQSMFGHFLDEDEALEWLFDGLDG